MYTPEPDTVSIGFHQVAVLDADESIFAGRSVEEKRHVGRRRVRSTMVHDVRLEQAIVHLRQEREAKHNYGKKRNRTHHNEKKAGRPGIGLPPREWTGFCRETRLSFDLDLDLAVDFGIFRQGSVYHSRIESVNPLPGLLGEHLESPPSGGISGTSGAAATLMEQAPDFR
jgi:hypothetical protein